MKKLFAIMLLFAGIVAMVFPVKTDAHVIDTPIDDPVIEEYEYMNWISCGLSINNGVASANATVSGKSSVTRCEMTLEIQERLGFL